MENSGEKKLKWNAEENTMANILQAENCKILCVVQQKQNTISK